MSEPSDRRGFLRQNAKPATLKELAAVQFEPIEGDPNEHTGPSPDEWVGDLTTFRIAYRLLFQTKGQLVDMVDSIGAEKLDEIATAIANMSDRLEAYREVLQSAEVRLISALAVVGLRMGAA